MKKNSKQRLHGEIAKRRKMPQVSLCNLPMDVLSHILSQLPINDAIRTSILSTKWKYIWCSHTNLTFNSGTMRKHYFKKSTGYGYGVLTDTEFITRVDTVIHQHSGGGIERMEVRFRLHKKHSDYIDRWINFAIATKTKELIIDLSGRHKTSLSRDSLYGIPRVREPYNLTSQLFGADIGLYLQRLELTSVALQLPADFKGFLSLKNLTLVDVSITDRDVQCILLRCNLLEVFEISYCRMITGIRTSHPLNHLKHLLVDKCPLLKVVELNCSPITLEYTGNIVPLIFASTSRLTNIHIKFLSYVAAINYMVTGFPNTLPSLETMTLQCCAEPERTILLGKPFTFTYLRHLRLGLVLNGEKSRKTDVLDYTYLLEVAPFMEKLELLMWMNYLHRPYCKEDGELRIRLPQQHNHLKFVRISGFFGHKGQVELALHILRSSVILEKMELIPMVEILECDEANKVFYEKAAYVNGHRIASEFVCKADHRNVVNAVRAPPSEWLPVHYGNGSGVREGHHGGTKTAEDVLKT